MFHHRLVAEFPDLLEKVDLFAGVSGGAILCSCLAAGAHELSQPCFLFRPKGWPIEKKKR